MVKGQKKHFMIKDMTSIVIYQFFKVKCALIMNNCSIVCVCVVGGGADKIMRSAGAKCPLLHKTKTWIHDSLHVHCVIRRVRKLRKY